MKSFRSRFISAVSALGHLKHQNLSNVYAILGVIQRLCQLMSMPCKQYKRMSKAKTPNVGLVIGARFDPESFIRPEVFKGLRLQVTISFES